MTAKSYRELILAGIADLPADSLGEIADFVLFVRKKRLAPQLFQEELNQLSLKLDLKSISRASQAHMEKEFSGYAERFPRK